MFAEYLLLLLFYFTASGTLSSHSFKVFVVVAFCVFVTNSVFWMAAVSVLISNISA